MDCKTAAFSLAALWLALCCDAQEAKPQPLQPVLIQQVQIDDAFWSPKFKIWREVTIPDCFDKFDRDGTLDNFDKVRDGKGEHRHEPWFDGLLYEMIRAAADFLIAKPDPKLEARLDNYINHIAAAATKDPNGYINTAGRGRCALLSRDRGEFSNGRLNEPIRQN